MKNIVILTAVMIVVASVNAFSQVGSAELANRKGLEEFNKKAYEPAARLFEQAIALKPGYASAYYNLGTAYFYLGRTRSSIDALTRAIKLNPNAAASRNQLGVVYLESGDTAAAIAEFEAAIRVRPDHPSAFYNLGCALIRSNDFASAVKTLERAKSLDPEDPEIRFNLAYALSREKRLNDAILEMETAVKLKPTDAELNLFLGHLFILKKDRGGATEQYAKLKTLDASRADRLYEALNRGRVISVSYPR